MRFGATLAFLALGLTAVGLRGLSNEAAAEERLPSQPLRVVVVRIEGIIDLGLAPLVERALRTAEAEGAKRVILEINTFGGRVDAAVAIRDHLLRSKVATVAFVNKRAISAGALISLAAHEIAMTTGGTVGAATPVQLGPGGEGAKPTDEKTVSYVRKEFRATAEARGRPVSIAEAMVDADVEIPGLVARGKLLTLTTEEALAHKVADYKAEDLPALLARLDLAGATIHRVDANWAEQVVRWLTHPIVSSLLMTFAMLGLIVEIRTPGFGVPGAIGLLCLVAFFWGHWLVRLVGWEDVALVAAGLVLLALELFVLPGFGAAGGLGLLALMAGLTSSLFGTGATASVVITAAARVAISAALALMGSLLLLRLLPAFPATRKLILSSALAPGGGDLPREADTSAEGPSLRATVGITVTPLRPAGIAELAGRRVDVVSTGGFIAAGRWVEVVEDTGSRVVVQVHAPRGEPGQGASKTEGDDE